MARKRAIKKRTSRLSASEEEKKTIKLHGFINSFNLQVANEIEGYEQASEKIVDAMKKKMHTTLLGIPEHVRKMTVQEYVEAYLQKVNGSFLQDIEVESKETAKITKPAKVTRTARKPTATKKVLKQTRKTSVSARKKSVFQTPSSTKPFSFKVVEGTPMLTLNGRRPNLLDKPRTLRSDDDISSIQLNLFSDQGSPVHFTGSQMSEEMRRKVAAAFQSVADELGK